MRVTRENSHLEISHVCDNGGWSGKDRLEETRGYLTWGGLPYPPGAGLYLRAATVLCDVGRSDFEHVRSHVSHLCLLVVDLIPRSSSRTEHDRYREGVCSLSPFNPARGGAPHRLGFI